MDTNLFYSEIHELTDEFQPKHERSLMLSSSYKRLGDVARSEKVAGCGTYLEFWHEMTDDGCIDPVGMLHRANFCKDRLCPCCAWRRSLKLFSQVSKIADRLGDSYRYLFLTLTVTNCKSDQLIKTISDLYRGFRRFIKRKRVEFNKDGSRKLFGFMRTLEVTYNERLDSFHPHLHVVLAMEKNYGSGRNFITQSEFCMLWSESFYGKAKKGEEQQRVIVDVRYAYDNKRGRIDGSTISEAVKYSVKHSDYLCTDPDQTDYLVQTFSEAFYHKRMIQFGGVFYDIFKDQEMQDVHDDSTDLVHIDGKFNPFVYHFVEVFGWTPYGYRLSKNYVSNPVISTDDSVEK